MRAPDPERAGGEDDHDRLALRGPALPRWMAWLALAGLLASAVASAWLVLGSDPAREDAPSASESRSPAPTR